LDVKQNVNDLNGQFNAEFMKADKLAALNPQALGFIPQHVSQSKSHNNATCSNDQEHVNLKCVKSCVSEG